MAAANTTWRRTDSTWFLCSHLMEDGTSCAARALYVSSSHGGPLRWDGEARCQVHVIDPIPCTVVRTLDGPAGRAELVDVAPLMERLPEVAATVATWFLTCPGQSPAWECYALSVVHLREMPGVPTPRIAKLGATHEVLLIACDPECKPVATDAATWWTLNPINLVHQVVLNDDSQALELAELAARAVVNGLLWAEPPLSGQREPWATTLDITAEHLRTGGHHE